MVSLFFIASLLVASSDTPQVSPFSGAKSRAKRTKSNLRHQRNRLLQGATRVEVGADVVAGAGLVVAVERQLVDGAPQAEAVLPTAILSPPRPPPTALSLKLSRLATPISPPSQSPLSHRSSNRTA